MRLRKRLGQHLLADERTLARIAEAAGARDGAFCLEIGPGTGNLTAALLAAGARVAAVEIDPEMAGALARRFPNEPRLDIVRADILSAPLDEIVPPAGRPAVAAGNLPYYISSPIIFRLLDHRELFSRIVVLVQKEVGGRMAAAPGSRAFGMLSVFCQAEADCEVLFEVGRASFRPPPKVDSRLVRLSPRPRGAAGIADERVFSAIVRGAFEHRRKTCYNSLRASLEKGACSKLAAAASSPPKPLLDEAFESLGLPRGARPEQLEIADFVKLANYFARGHHNHTRPEPKKD